MPVDTAVQEPAKQIAGEVADAVPDALDLNRPGESGRLHLLRRMELWDERAGIRLSCGSVQCAWSWRSRARVPVAVGAAITAVAQKPGAGTAETLREWVRRAEIDGGLRPGMTSEEHAESKRLKREAAELHRANEISKAASAYFAAELDRPQPRS